MRWQTRGKRQRWAGDGWRAVDAAAANSSEPPPPCGPSPHRTVGDNDCLCWTSVWPVISPAQPANRNTRSSCPSPRLSRAGGGSRQEDRGHAHHPGTEDTAGSQQEARGTRGQGRRQRVGGQDRLPEWAPAHRRRRPATVDSSNSQHPEVNEGQPEDTKTPGM